jgi:hypothetical protein
LFVILSAAAYAGIFLRGLFREADRVTQLVLPSKHEARWGSDFIVAPPTRAVACSGSLSSLDRAAALHGPRLQSKSHLAAVWA